MPMLVELKSGETYNGHLVACDDWMNIHLKEVICTSKYLRIPDDVIDKVKEDMQVSRMRNRNQGGGEGGGRGGARNKFRGGHRGGGPGQRGGRIGSGGNRGGHKDM
ncbi:unnamed protein product [Dibothriocephalus latus]|uniref:U6 snRNA-associated Sm-like protein LSm4 n=1 Tax=Dibothriocephalus latus TaxID=60516 RepID=A0A3P7NYD2_DIBLA|nr:unnamed protein product [Dibothriocephalus latus]